MISVDDYIRTVKEFRRRLDSSSLDEYNQDYTTFLETTKLFCEAGHALFMTGSGPVMFHDGFLKVTEKRLPSGEFSVAFKGQGFVFDDEGGGHLRQNISFTLQSPVSWRAMNCREIYDFCADGMGSMGFLFWDEGCLRAVSGAFSHLSVSLGSKRPFVKKETLSANGLLEICLKNGEVIEMDALWTTKRKVFVKQDQHFIPFERFINEFSKNHWVKKTRIKLLDNNSISSYVKVSKDDYCNTNRALRKVLK